MRAERVAGVSWSWTGDGALEDDGAVVELLVDEMDGAAGKLDAEVEGLGLGFEAGEGGEQRRVDVEDAVGKRGDKGGGNEAHVAGEADEVDVVVEERFDVWLVALVEGEAGGGEVEGGEVEVAGGGEAGGLGTVGKDESDLGVGDFVAGDGGVDGEEVGAAAGEEDGEPGHWGGSEDCRFAIASVTARSTSGRLAWMVSQMRPSSILSYSWRSTLPRPRRSRQLTSRTKRRRVGTQTKDRFRDDLQAPLHGVLQHAIVNVRSERLFFQVETNLPNTHENVVQVQRCSRRHRCTQPVLRP